MMTVVATFGFLLFVAAVVAALARLEPHLNDARSERTRRRRDDMLRNIDSADWPEWS